MRCRGRGRKLVDRANEWLQLNVGVCQAMTCETITWCAVNPQSLGDSEQMALSTSIERGSKTFYLRGLRYAEILHGVTYTRCLMNSQITDTLPADTS